MEVIHNLLFNILLWTSAFEFTYGFIEMCPDFGLTAEQIIRKHNYPFEKHMVLTEDGYFLEVHRILPNAKFKNKTKNVQSVLLFSGLFADSATWVSLGPQKGLGFVLSDHGYDVWMGNNRGSTLSKNHIVFDPYKDKKKFWNFSFQELGYYDIPATIDYVLNVTKQEKLLYLGYSQGTSSYFAMLSDKPNYNNKIAFAIALAPVISIQNCLSVSIRLLMQNVRHLEDLMKSLDMYELLPHSNNMISLAVHYCNTNSSFLNTCAEFVCSSFAVSMEQLNQSTIPLLLSNSPAGASVKEALHLLQLNNGIFKKFDYGRNGNLKIYGEENPPIYNLSNVNIPTAIIYGSYDVLASQKDVELLAPQLPNLVGMKLIPKFNHVDLSIGIDAPTLVFPEILNYLDMYS